MTKQIEEIKIRSKTNGENVCKHSPNLVHSVRKQNRNRRAYRALAQIKKTIVATQRGRIFFLRRVRCIEMEYIILGRLITPRTIYIRKIKCCL